MDVPDGRADVLVWMEPSDGHSGVRSDGDNEGRPEGCCGGLVWMESIGFTTTPFSYPIFQEFNTMGILVITALGKPTDLMVKAIQAVKSDFQPYGDLPNFNIEGVKIMKPRHNGKSVITTSHLSIRGNRLVPGFTIGLGQLGPDMFHADGTQVGAKLSYWGQADFGSPEELAELVQLHSDLNARGYISETGKILYSEEQNEGFRLANLTVKPKGFMIVEIDDTPMEEFQKPFFSINTCTVYECEWTTSVANTNNAAIDAVLEAAGAPKRVSNHIGVVPPVVANVGSSTTTPPVAPPATPSRTLAVFG